MDLTAFENQRYNAEQNNCMHFAALIHHTVTGIEIFESVRELCTSNEKKVVDPRKLRHFKPTDTPKNGSLVSMRLRQLVKDEAHVGIFFDRKVIHLTESGVRYEPLHFIQKQYYALKFYDYEN